MAYKAQLTPLASISADPSQSVQNRQFSDMDNGTNSEFVDIVLTGTLTIATAAAAAILNRGSIWAAIASVGIVEDGTDKFVMDGKVARFLSEQAAPSALTAVRLASTAVGVTQLREIVRLYFGHPFSAKPTDTFYRERNVQKKLRAFLQLRNSAAAAIATAGGGGTVTLTNVVATVYQSHDRFLTTPPLLLPFVQQSIVPVTQAVTNQRSDISTSRYIRFMVISQETDQVGEVNDILTSFALRGDARDIIGPQAALVQDLENAQELEYGGAVYASGNHAHLGLNFAQRGRLAGCINPYQDTNLRLVLNGQPSASAGNSFLRITTYELEQVPGLTAAKLPFTI